MQSSKTGEAGVWPLLARCIGALPLSALLPFGAALGVLAGSVLRIRRRHVEQAMLAGGVEDVRRRARDMYRALGKSACEFLWLAAKAPRAVDELARIEPESARRLAELLGEGRGVVLAASHTGNWDLAACTIARRAPLLVVTKRLHARALDAFWHRTRGAYGVRLVEPLGAARHVRAELARGGLVAMMIDQVPSDAAHAMRVKFLGQDAYVDRAPATLAARAGAPLVVSVARRTPSGITELAILDVLEPPRRHPAGEILPHRRADWIDAATESATRLLETFVLRHPADWLWLHRRWKVPPVRARRPPGTRLRAVDSAEPLQ